MLPLSAEAVAALNQACHELGFTLAEAA